MNQDIVPTQAYIRRSTVRNRVAADRALGATSAYSRLYSRRPIINATPLPQSPAAQPIVSVAATKSVKPQRMIHDVKKVQREQVEHPASVYEKALIQARAEVSEKIDKKTRIKRTIIFCLAGALLLTTGYVAVNTLLINSRLEATAIQEPDTISANNAENTAESAMFPGGADTTAPAQNALASYTVAADLPRTLQINGLKINAKVKPMGLVDGMLESPKNIYDAGWYTGSAKPGQNGAMVIDGHASETGSHYGLFGYLDRIKSGDQITIERGDGTKMQYKVAAIETKAIADVDMKAVMKPYGGAAQGLNIITCTGQWTSDKSTLDHRLIVYATAD